MRCRTDLGRETRPPGKNLLHYGPFEEMARSSRAEIKRFFSTIWQVTFGRTWKIIHPTCVKSRVILQVTTVDEGNSFRPF